MLKNNFNALNPTEGKGRGRGPVLLVVLLLAALLATFGGSYALYQSSATVTVGTAGVAAYAVSAGSSSGNLEIDCNDVDTSESFNFWVKNSKGGKAAEVAVQYSVDVALSSALPTGIAMQLDGANGVKSGDGKTYTFTGGTFEAGVEGTGNHALTFIVDPDEIENSVEISNIVLTVRTEQID